MTKSLRERIRGIPGDYGWKHQEDALAVAEKMLNRGVDEDTIVEWIGDIYWEAASGFGA